MAGHGQSGQKNHNMTNVWINPQAKFEKYLPQETDL